MTGAPVALLDLDGTLADSAPGITRCVAHAFTALGLPVPPPDVLRGFVGPPLHASFARLGVPADAAVEAYRSRYRTLGITEQTRYDGVLGMLETLRSEGWVLALATSKPEVFARRIVVDLELAHLLEGVTGSELDGRRSRKGEVVAEALARLGRAPGGDVVLVGDRVEDAVGAGEQGIGFVGAGWGYAVPGELAGHPVAGSPGEVVTLLRQLARHA